MIMSELLFQYTHVQNNEYNIRLAITGACDIKAGLSHMVVIICMSMYLYALFYHCGSYKNVIFFFFFFIKNITGRYIIYRIVVMEWW